MNWSKCKQTQERWATWGDGMYIRVIMLPRHLHPFHFHNQRAPYQRHVTIKLIIIIILRQKRKRSKQRQNGTKIIDYSKRVTIQYCTYYIMIRFVPGGSFLPRFGNFTGHILRFQSKEQRSEYSLKIQPVLSRFLHQFIVWISKSLMSEKQYFRTNDYRNF